MDACLSDNLGTVPLDSMLLHNYVMQNPLSRHTQQNGKRRRASLVTTIFDELSKPGLSSFEGMLGSLPVNPIFEGSTQRKWRGLVRATSGLDGLLSQHNGQYIPFLDSDLTKVGGLVRSQSYPPEGWQGVSREYVLNVSSQMAQNADGSAFDAVHYEVSVIKAAKIFATARGEALQIKENAKPPNNTGCDITINPAVYSETVVTLQEPIMNVRTMSADLEHNLQAANGSLTPFSKSVGDSTSPDESVNQLNSCSTARCCPPSGKMLERKEMENDVIVMPTFSATGPNESVKQLKSCTTVRCCPPSGKMLERGRRNEMEDAVTIMPTFSTIPCGTSGMCLCHKGSHNTTCHWNFFGVYDGHGGSQASSYCKQRLHILLADQLSSACTRKDERDDRSRWEEIMIDSFLKIDMEVGGVCPSGVCNDDLLENTSCSACQNVIAPENVGTTAVVAIVGSCQMVIANCGDSRAVLSRGGKAIPLSTDHKPERADETRRIESAGGSVIYWDGYRVGGFLALSRAIGDRYLKRYVTSEPEVVCIKREEEDECLILASDGLWDVVSNDCACEVARRGLVSRRKRGKATLKGRGEDPAAISVATFLTKLAYSRGSKDNISVIVVDLQR